MEDEPFDAQPAQSASPATPVLRKSSPSVPPSSAFNFGAAAPTPVTPEEEPVTVPVPPAPVFSSDPSIMSSELPDRWKQHETEMDHHRSESSLGVTRSVNSAAEREAARGYLQEDEGALRTRASVATTTPTKPLSSQEQPYTNYSLYETPSPSAKKIGGLAPRQPYNFKKSSSYDTDELIRKYGGMAGIPSVMSSRPTTPSVPIVVPRTDDVRGEALRVLDLVDGHLGSPGSVLDVQRTQSGGFRAAPAIIAEETEEPYAVERTISGTGKRVPAALSGLNFSAKGRTTSWNAGRLSFSDPSFREDDHISDEEDDIIHQAPFQDEQVVDIVKLENRAAGSRANSNANDFDGDFPQNPKSWSSRYAEPISSQNRILDQWDREFEQDRQGARKMFMSTASNMKSAATSVWSKAGVQKDKIFGSGFSFRSNHVYGHHKTEKPEINLRTVWKDVELDDDPNVHGPERVHKTWQQVLLNKKKRRRLIGVTLIFLLAIIVGVTTGAQLGKKRAAVKSNGSGVGSPVTFYVTSDVPYDQAEEDKLSKDLLNIPGDAEFVIHLGNIQEAAVSFCPTTRYSDVASVLKKSPVPIFVIPGEEDWIKCPNPAEAMENWSEAFVNFDDHFNHGYRVFRDSNYPEAFAMLHNGVLFLGLHVVSGPVVDTEEWKKREVEMLTFFFGMTNLHKKQFRAIAVLGNARPSPQQEGLLNAVANGLKDIGRPLAYIHANSGGDSVRQYKPYSNQKNMFGIGIEDGGKNPPLKITVGFGERPFLVG